MSAGPDIQIVRDDELMVAHVEGTTDAAEDFIDGYFPDVEYTVLDRGRIIIHRDGFAAFVLAAERRGLTVGEC